VVFHLGWCLDINQLRYCRNPQADPADPPALPLAQRKLFMKWASSETGAGTGDATGDRVKGQGGLRNHHGFHHELHGNLTWIETNPN